MTEERENYNVLLQKIRDLGPINEILNNPTMIKQIIAYPGDRHLICAFFEIVNAELKKGTLNESDLEFFRSGDLMDAIVNLDKTIAEVNPRSIYPAERLDKINYVSLIQDPKTLAVSYTHPVIMDALCGKIDSETHTDALCGKIDSGTHTDDLLWWSRCGTFDTMNPKVKLVIISELLKNGGVAASVQGVLERNYGGLQSYAQKNSEKEAGFTM